MDSEVLLNDAVQPPRRLTRQMTKVKLTGRAPLRRSRDLDESSENDVTYELPHRAALKRGREKIPSASFNGSKDLDESSENGDSPRKKPKPDMDLERDCSGNDEEMDFQETDEDEHRDQEHNDNQLMCPEEHSITQQKEETSRRLNSSTNFGSQHQPLVNCQEFRMYKSSSMAKCMEKMAGNPESKEETSRKSDSRSNFVSQPQPRQEFLPYKTGSMAEYREKMMGKPKSTANHQSMKVYPTSEVSYLSSHRVNSITTKKNTQPQKQDIKKPALTKANPGKSSGGCMWQLCQVVLLLVVSIVGLLAFQNLPLNHTPSAGRDHPDWPVREGEFGARLSALVAMFPSQHSELWRRTRIHLERHLQMAQPTEPVSLMLTAGHSGERTLHCLANRLAFAYSSALNTSVLQIDGASKAGQDSDLVKLEVDNQLREAFEGDQSVAVIHRFEELPPGSALIFYKYCDHENAAFKRVFLAFTVLLPEEELEKQFTMNAVEERVQDFIKDKFVGTKSLDNRAFFNTMDLDKLSGLWSRISHLVLPVAAEESIEHGGCTN